MTISGSLHLSLQHPNLNPNPHLHLHPTCTQVITVLQNLAIEQQEIILTIEMMMDLGPGLSSSVPMDEPVKRTLFLRTPTYSPELSKDDIANWFSAFGAVADAVFFPKKGGIGYVMYHDSRASQQAIRQADDNIIIKGVEFTVQPSRHRPDAKGRAPHNGDYQATVLFSLEEGAGEFVKDDMRLFESFGAISSAHPYKSSKNELVVEYYDCRAANEAALSCHGKRLHQGTMYTTLLWDGSGSEPKNNNDSSAPSAVLRERKNVMPTGELQNDRPPKHMSHHGDGRRSPHQLQKQKPHSQTKRPREIADLAQGHDDVLNGTEATLFRYPVSSCNALFGYWKRQRFQSSTSVDDKIKHESEGNMDVIARIAKDPSLIQKAQAAKEILQQHQSLLGLCMGTISSNVAEKDMLQLSTAAESNSVHEKTNADGVGSPMNENKVDTEPLPAATLSLSQSSNPAALKSTVSNELNEKVAEVTGDSNNAATTANPLLQNDPDSDPKHGDSNETAVGHEKEQKDSQLAINILYENTLKTLGDSASSAYFGNHDSILCGSQSASILQSPVTAVQDGEYHQQWHPDAAQTRPDNGMSKPAPALAAGAVGATAVSGGASHVDGINRLLGILAQVQKASSSSVHPDGSSN
ncbi:hypothetical protein GGI07_004444 [Coemansia sp. Benny D115]|nr:hypothetical protein GGI07_004444 [Coemansia sp. Benny D115]